MALESAFICSLMAFTVPATWAATRSISYLASSASACSFCSAASAAERSLREPPFTTAMS